MFKEDLDLSGSCCVVVSEDQNSYVAYVYDRCWRKRNACAREIM